MWTNICELLAQTQTQYIIYTMLCINCSVVLILTYIAYSFAFFPGLDGMPLPSPPALAVKVLRPATVIMRGHPALRVGQINVSCNWTTHRRIMSPQTYIMADLNSEKRTLHLSQNKHHL